MPVLRAEDRGVEQTEEALNSLTRKIATEIEETEEDCTSRVATAPQNLDLLRGSVIIT
jgi:hypothetical protein